MPIELDGLRVCLVSASYIGNVGMGLGFDRIIREAMVSDFPNCPIPDGALNEQPGISAKKPLRVARIGGCSFPNAKSDFRDLGKRNDAALLRAFAG